MNYLFIADLFVEDGVQGGAEMCNDELIKKLIGRGHNVSTVHSFFTSIDVIQTVAPDIIIFGNFLGLQHSVIDFVKNSGVKYFIYEHDFKFLSTRDSSVFPNHLAPPEHIIHREFYTNAYKIIAQSNRHKSIIEKNLGNNNVISAINLWTEDHIKDLEEYQDTPKEYECAVLGHIYSQKNQVGAEKYCLENGLNYLLIPYNTPHNEFCQQLSKCKNLVFFPQVNETLSRICVEANCLNAELIVNDNISYKDESWSNLRGQELINYLKSGAEETINIFES